MNVQQVDSVLVVLQPKHVPALVQQGDMESVVQRASSVLPRVKPAGMGTRVPLPVSVQLLALRDHMEMAVHSTVRAMAIVQKENFQWERRTNAPIVPQVVSSQILAKANVLLALLVWYRVSLCMSHLFL